MSQCLSNKTLIAFNYNERQHPLCQMMLQMFYHIDVCFGGLKSIMQEENTTFVCALYTFVLQIFCSIARKVVSIMAPLIFSKENNGIRVGGSIFTDIY